VCSSELKGGGKKPWLALFRSLPFPSPQATPFLFIPSEIPIGFLDPFAEEADKKLRDHLPFR
jgi:hypothetical protein